MVLIFHLIFVPCVLLVLLPELNFHLELLVLRFLQIGLKLGSFTSIHMLFSCLNFVGWKEEKRDFVIESLTLIFNS